MALKTSYTVAQILQIITDWTTPAAIKILNKKVGKMTKKSRLYESHEVASSKDGNLISLFFFGVGVASMIRRVL